MEGIKIYTIDSKKMIKKGLPGWNPHQEHAKTYHRSIEKDDKKYNINISDGKLIKELFEFTSVPKEKRILDIEDYGILISVRHISDNRYCMTIYYHPKDAYVEHHTISNYSRNDSDYTLAENIVRWINAKVV